MGIGGISVWQLLIILVIVVLLFGTKKIRSLGGDLGSAIKNFKNSMQDGEDQQKEEQQLRHEAEEENDKQQTSQTKDEHKS